jgi:hypothetical protein
VARQRRTTPEPEAAAGLAHVLVVGGTAAEWAEFGIDAWRERVTSFAATVASFDVPWLTIRPIGGVFAPSALPALADDLVAAMGGTVEGNDEVKGVVSGAVHGVTVFVGLQVDGRQRIADTISELAARGVRPDAVDEELLIGSLLAPSGAEPDLVVILGPPDRLPRSVVWELAYAEIVYLDLPWAQLDATHLQLAVDDFRRRDRRFGGIDA